MMKEGRIMSRSRMHKAGKRKFLDGSPCSQICLEASG